MAEDIDDLLEEVESKFLTKDKKQSRSKNNRKEKRLAFYCSTPKERNLKNLEVYSFIFIVVRLSLVLNVTFSFIRNLDHVE